MSIYAFLFLILVAAAVFVIATGYNGMRRHAEGVKESFSNISVVTRKKPLSSINSLPWWAIMPNRKSS